MSEKKDNKNNNNIIIMVVAIVLSLIAVTWFYFVNNPDSINIGESNKIIENKELNKGELKVETGDKVSVHYTWTFKDDGKKFDSSYDRWQPIEFTIWKQEMIPWFEKAIVGMKIWEKKTITLEPKDAYGEYDKNAKEVVPREQLAQFESQIAPKKDVEKYNNWKEIKVWDIISGFTIKAINWENVTLWMKLEKWAKIPTQMWEVEILAVDDKNITLNKNHPMAWKSLIFAVEIVDVKRIAPRTEEKAKLEVFLMWYCPFGEIATKQLPILQNNFKDSIKFGFHYIATKKWDWFKTSDFESLHWVTEVEEDIRQLCIQKNYDTKTLIAYMQTRYANADNHWIVKDDKKLAYDANKIDAKKIDTCVENWEWGKLLAEDIKIAEELSISGSPTWLANNKFNFGWIEAAAIQTEFCKNNTELAGCKTVIATGTPSAASNVACQK